MSQTMITRHVEIINPKGLHARASAKLAKLATALPTKVVIQHEGETADARSIMDLLCLGAAMGCELTLQAGGPEAEATLDRIEALVRDGFGELSEDQQSACR